MSDDIFIGFTPKPEGLEAFLEKEGYEKSIDQPSPDSTLYFSPTHGVDVWYCPKADMSGEKEEVPNWRVLRFKHINVVSDLNINFFSNNTSIYSRNFTFLSKRSYRLLFKSYFINKIPVLLFFWVAILKADMPLYSDTLICLAISKCSVKIYSNI